MEKIEKTNEEKNNLRHKEVLDSITNINSRMNSIENNVRDEIQTVKTDLEVMKTANKEKNKDTESKVNENFKLLTARIADMEDSMKHNKENNPIPQLINLEQPKSITESQSKIPIITYQPFQTNITSRQSKPRYSSARREILSKFADFRKRLALGWSWRTFTGRLRRT